MYTIYYIVLVLLQFSFGKELSEYKRETPQELETPMSNELTEENLVHIEPSSVETTLKTADDILLNAENDVEEPLEPISTANFGGSVKAEGKVTIAAEYECGESCDTGTSDEEIIEEDTDDDETVHINNIILGSPVLAEGKVTIIAHLCDDTDDDKGHISDEKDPKDCGDDFDEITPNISFSGPVKAHGKVSIATHFGYEENSRNIAPTSYETDCNEIVYEEGPDGAVIFGGPVHAQGKVSIGTHFGCGPPVGIPPIFLPLPRFSTLHYPTFYNPSPYSIPGSFLAQFPFPMPETKPFTTPRFQEYNTDNEPRNLADSQEYLPIASILANSIPDGSAEFEDDTYGNVVFNGVVPAHGTVSIAARF